MLLGWWWACMIGVYCEKWPLWYMLSFCCFLSTKLQVGALKFKLLQRFILPCFRTFRPYMIFKGSQPPSMSLLHQKQSRHDLYFLMWLICFKNSQNGRLLIPNSRLLTSGVAALSLIRFKIRQKDNFIFCTKNVEVYIQELNSITHQSPLLKSMQYTPIGL